MARHHAGLPLSTTKEVEGNMKTPKRSANWSKEETLKMLELRKEYMRTVAAGISCLRGKDIWNEMAEQLVVARYERRKGNHVSERWDTLRKVYLAIEEYCRETKCLYVNVLEGNRIEFHRKYKMKIPLDYKETWHQLIAEGKPGERRNGKKRKVDDRLEENLIPHIEDMPVQNSVSWSLIEESSTLAHGFDSFIKSIEAVFACHGLENSRDSTYQASGNKILNQSGVQEEGVTRMNQDEHSFDAMKLKVVATLQCLVATMQSTKSKYTCPDSHVLEFKKHDWTLVETMLAAFAKRHLGTPTQAHGSRPFKVGHMNDPPWASLCTVCNGGDENIMFKMIMEIGSEEHIDFLLEDCPKSPPVEVTIPTSEKGIVKLSEDSQTSSEVVVTSPTRSPNPKGNFKELVWPPNDPTSTSVTEDDMKSLEPGMLVNGSIVAFCVNYIAKIYSADDERAHFFSNAFYTELLRANLDRSALKSINDWTTKADIFNKKDFVFVPVIESDHWSLVIICYLWQSWSPNRRAANSGKPMCVLHLNSSRQSTHLGVKKHIDFLLEEHWIQKNGGYPQPLNIPFISAKVPQQQNNTDCALFMLEYLELFLREKPKRISSITERWFSPADIPTKRHKIRELIMELYQKNTPKRGLTVVEDKSSPKRFPTGLNKWKRPWDGPGN